MTEEERKALQQINNHENELRELRRDIHALAIIEIYHASGAVVASSQTPLTTTQLNECNSAKERFSRYAQRS